MKALTYVEPGRFALLEKPKPSLQDPGDAIVRVTLSSICTSDLHIKHGSVPRAVPGVTVGHEMVGVVEQVGSQVRTVRPGDRVTVNVETFCGQCFFCKRGYVNNCTDPNGGWALGCRIDGGQAEYVRVPYAGQGLNRIPASVTDEQALFVGDILATGFWAARISAIQPEDTVLILGAGPTGICTLLCALLKNPRRVIVCEKDPARRAFVQEHYPQALLCGPEECERFVGENSPHGGADVVLEAAGGKDTFALAWKCARPNGLVTVVALIFTKKSNACRNIYYVGSNENAAKLSGINVDRVKIFVYVVIALLSALAGILSLARFNVATPELSKGAETTAISAAVIGGTSMTGGLGGILGTFLGIFLLKIVDSALVMMNVSVYWQDFVQGAILVIAVTIDYMSHRKSGNSFLQRMLGLGRRKPALRP